MATPPSTGYAVRSVTAGALLSDWTSLVDVEEMPTEWKALVDTSDGTKVRIFLDDGTTRLAVDPMFFDGVAVTGHYRFLIPTFSGVVPTTIRIYPPVDDNDTVAEGDLYGSDNARDPDWVLHLGLDADVNNLPDGYEDSTKWGNDGTGNSMSLPEVDGQIGKAQDFDGADDWISIPDSASLKITEAISLFAWVNIDVQAEANEDTIISKYHHVTRGYLLRYDSLNNELDSDVGDAGGEASAKNVVAIEGAWHHVGFTWDKSTVRPYLDGVALGTTIEYSRSLGDSTFPVRIGETPHNNNDRLKGLIDEAQIHSVARSPEWVREEKDQTFDNPTYWGVWAWEPFTSPATFDIILADTVYIMQVAADNVVIKQLASDTVNIVQVDSDTVGL